MRAQVALQAIVRSSPAITWLQHGPNPFFGMLRGMCAAGSSKAADEQQAPNVSSAAPDAAAAPMSQSMSEGTPAAAAAPRAAAGTWKGPAGQPPPLPPPHIAALTANTLRRPTPGAAAAAALDASDGPITAMAASQVALASIPPVPKLLGFAGTLLVQLGPKRACKAIDQAINTCVRKHRAPLLHSMTLQNVLFTRLAHIQ